MSHSARIRRFFGEGEFDFALTIGPAEDLELNRSDKLRKMGFDAGQGAIMAIQARLAGGTFLIDDVRQTLRLSLIGAGMEPEDAFRLVERNLKPGYVIKAAMVAGDVIDALLSGDPEDQPGADRPGEPDGQPVPIQPGSPTGASDGPGSTAKAPRSASRRRKSGDLPSGS